MGIQGTWLYRPSFGASGSAEYTLFDTGLASADYILANHATRHAIGGADEVSGLSAHASRHAIGGADEITELGTHASRHAIGGADEVPGLSAHASRHAIGGADEVPGLSAHASRHDVGGDDAINYETLNPYIDHGLLSGTADDDHSQYALLAGRSGGQTFIAGTGAGDELALQTSSDPTKGKIKLGSDGGNFYFDDVNKKFYIVRTVTSSSDSMFGPWEGYYHDHAELTSADQVWGFYQEMLSLSGAGFAHAIGAQAICQRNSGEHCGVYGAGGANHANVSSGATVFGADFQAYSTSAVTYEPVMRGVNIGIHPRKADNPNGIGLYINNTKGWPDGATNNYLVQTAIKIEGLKYDDTHGFEHFIEGYDSAVKFDVLWNGKVGLGAAAASSYMIYALSPTSEDAVMLLTAQSNNQYAYIDATAKDGSGNPITTRMWSHISGLVAIGSTTNHPLSLLVAATERARVVSTCATGEAALWITTNCTGDLALQQVTLGTSDSGGAGYKLLRIPNGD